MVSVGLKALILKRFSRCSLVENSLMGGENRGYKQGRRKKGRKARHESSSFDGDNYGKRASGRLADGDVRHKKFSKTEPSFIRKQVDPDTTKYFSEIANLFESGEVDLEERSVICGNALEEARGKELELATDYIISHTMQSLLEACSVDHLCAFLRGCAQVFPLIAMDRSGSHVAESSLKSLESHLQDNEAFSVIEETLTMICKVIAADPLDMMCNCHGSHVLRSLLCLCGGVPLDSPEFHKTKPSAVLAQRLNLKPSWGTEIGSQHHHQGFPALLKFLILEMLRCAGDDIKALLVDQYSSLVLQTALKLIAGHEQEVVQIIPVLLGCGGENLMEGDFIPMTAVGDIVELMKETAYSHLMEVILGVTPKGLYDEMLSKVFRNLLFELASHHCGNFVVQALVSHASDQEQMELIWEELGPKFRDLLEMGRPGVIASLIAAIQRLQTHEHECCLALASAVSLPNESPTCIVPRILFLEDYFVCEDKSNWTWPNGVKMHVMGSLILQAVFKFQSNLIQPYVMSITSLDADHVFETAKDAAGARAIEAFLGSNVSGKQKYRLIKKLQGHFGELSMHSSGSFTVEKCFAASNLTLREAIASDMLAVQSELAKTKQGPYLLRKLDIDWFASRPDRWRSKQASKESVYKEFSDAFGSGETKSRGDFFLADTSKNASESNGLKQMRKEIDDQMASQKHAKHDMANHVKPNQKSKNKRVDTGSDIGGASGKVGENVNKKPFLSSEIKGKKRPLKDEPSKAARKRVLERINKREERELVERTLERISVAEILNLLLCDSFCLLMEACTWTKKGYLSKLSSERKGGR